MTACIATLNDSKTQISGKVADTGQYQRLGVYTPDQIPIEKTLARLVMTN